MILPITQQFFKFMIQPLRHLLFVICVILFAEVFCRIWSPEYRRDVYKYDSAGVVRHKSNYSAKVYSDRNPLGWMQLDTDNNGLRIQKGPSPEFSGRKIKVLLLGDSLSYGQHMNYKDTFARLLGQKLSSNINSPVEILNCSVVAANLIELFNAYNNLCHFKEIDLVIVQPTVYDGPSPFALFYGEGMGSDFQLIAFLHQCFPKINLEPFLLQDEFGLLGMDKRETSLRQIYSRYFGAWTPLYPWLHLSRKIEHNYVMKYKFSCRDLKFPLLYTHEAMETHHRIEEKYKLSPVHLPNSNYALRILKKWSEKVLNNNGKFLVIGLPNARGLNIASSRKNLPKKQFITKVFKKRSQMQLDTHKLMYDSFLNELKKEKIDTLDFLTILSKFETKQIFIEDDIHFNENGHKVIASALASYILDQKLLK